MNMRLLWSRMGLAIACLGLVLVWCIWGTPAATANEISINDQASSVAERLCVDTGQKIDLNNANLMAFTDCPGFYPTLATMIVQQGPYDHVEDVLNIPDLNEQQQQMLKANLDFFSVSTPVVPLEMRMPPRSSR